MSVAALSHLSELVAKQLNDHTTSPRGVEQRTYYTWTEHHIHDAIQVALSYLYGIKPDAFSKKACYETLVLGCTIDLADVCCKVTTIVGVNSDCDNVTEQQAETMSLLPFLNVGACAEGEGEAATYTFKTLNPTTFQFSSPLPLGTKIFFMCARPPTIGDVDDCVLAEYEALIVPFTLWFLLLTDNESRSNPLRWEAYYKAVQDFVTLKLRIEFSLRAEDYIDGHKLSSRREIDV